MKCMHTSYLRVYDIWFQFGICFLLFSREHTHNRIISHYLNIVFCFSNRPIRSHTRTHAHAHMHTFLRWKTRKPFEELSYHVHTVYPFHVCVRCMFFSSPKKPNWNRTIVQMQLKCEIENGLMRDIEFNIDTSCACVCMSGRGIRAHAWNELNIHCKEWIAIGDS